MRLLQAIAKDLIASNASLNGRSCAIAVDSMRTAGSNPDVLNLIRLLVSVDPEPAGEIWDQFFRPKQDFLIDPVAMAERYGSPISQKVVANTAAWEQQRHEQPIDGGAAALDMLLRKVGIQSNLSGFGNPPTVRYPIANDIHYKRQFKPLTGPARRDSKQPGTIVEYVGFTDTPMMDWDLPGPSHVDRNVTIRNLGDVEDLIQDYVSRHPDSRLQLYQTPGGFRAWETSERMNTQEFQPRFEELKVDPDYALLSNTGFGRTVRGIPIDPPTFRARVSHKPGRTDWVAQPIATFSGSEAMPDPRSLAVISSFHDEPIRKRYLTQNGANPAAIRSLQQQLPTASATLQAQLRNRFSI